MKASGNGTPQTCVQNLLKTTRGEVPYERIKGIDRSLIDQPSETAASELAAEVEFVVETTRTDRHAAECGGEDADVRPVDEIKLRQTRIAIDVIGREYDVRLEARAL